MFRRFYYIALMSGLQFHFCNHRKQHVGKFIIDLFETEDWTVFPTCFTVSKPGEVPSRSTLQYGFWSWGDHATHSFVQLVIEPDIMTYYFVNFTRELKEFIEASLKDYSGSRVAPVLLDYWILTQLLSSYRRGLGTQRLKLRQIEHDDDDSTVQNQARELHELCRTWHVMLKDFGDLKEHTRQLKAFGRGLNTTYRNTQPHRRDDVLEIIDSLAQFEDNCKFWASWAKTYLDRTNICINLSILGTNFFNFDGVVFTVSSLWWILPVTSIPLTLAVILFWYKWSKTRSEKTHVQFTEELPEKRAWDLPDPVRKMRKLMP
ncbi:hypothetical protein E0Z10_g10425 [Xylaria hypoxylon]|uniref:Uncharacterized protein n=1 Tax=Xylaria hypoxylon TaxID=37992 RepID=A0A4Z0Y316_9PEZI|nr:hypothetical protein E0Z10_g10425 [Xylaria hypoxylon]